MTPLSDRQHDAFDNAAKMACREAGYVGVLGAFEIYRGKRRGHRMANLRLILR